MLRYKKPASPHSAAQLSPHVAPSHGAVRGGFVPPWLLHKRLLSPRCVFSFGPWCLPAGARLHEEIKAAGTCWRGASPADTPQPQPHRVISGAVTAARTNKGPTSANFTLSNCTSFCQSSD